MTMSAAQILAGISPALVKRAVMFTHIFVWTQEAGVRNLALSLGERVVRQLTDSEPGEGSFLFE